MRVYAAAFTFIGAIYSYYLNADNVLYKQVQRYGITQSSGAGKEERKLGAIPYFYRTLVF